MEQLPSNGGTWFLGRAALLPGLCGGACDLEVEHEGEEDGVKIVDDGVKIPSSYCPLALLQPNRKYGSSLAFIQTDNRVPKHWVGSVLFRYIPKPKRMMRCTGDYQCACV